MKTTIFNQMMIRAACLAIAAILSFVGCATPKGTVLSQRDPSFAGKLENVLVICPDKRVSAALGGEFASRFLNRLTNSFAQHRVSAGSVELNKDALDNDALIQKASNHFKTGQLLAWSIVEMNSMSSVRQTLPGDIPRFQSSTSVGLAFQVSDVWANKIVWRARIRFQMIPRPEDVADQLVEELAKAKLLIPQSVP